jgi:hypothetical protein
MDTHYLEFITLLPHRTELLRERLHGLSGASRMVYENEKVHLVRNYPAVNTPTTLFSSNQRIQIELSNCRLLFG